MKMSVFHVADMHCLSCQTRIEDAVASMPGVIGVRANPSNREVFVDHDEQQVPVLEVFGLIEKLGFTPLLGSVDEQKELHGLLKRLGVAAICMMQVVMQALALYFGEYRGMDIEQMRLLHIASFVFCLPVMFYSAQPFFRNAWSSLKSASTLKKLVTSLSMDVPVALALVIAFSASTLTIYRGQGEVYFDSVVMFTFLLLCARFIDQKLISQRRTSNALSLLPENCTRVESNGDRVVALSELNVGDRVLVRPGDRVVADGVVVKGVAYVDESLLTGESDVVTRAAGHAVTAGTVNYHQSFEFSVTRLGSDLRLAQIEEIANHALKHRPKTVTRASQIASYFVALMISAAILTCLYWLVFDASQALTATIAVLVVSCPCALALATPAAINAALSRLQRRGVLVRNSEVLQVASRIRGIAFDKTGTLTTGNLVVKKIELLGHLTKEQCFALAAGLERGSQHPIARAFDGISASELAGTTIDSQGVTGGTIFGVCRIGTKEYCVPGSAFSSKHEDQRSVWLSVERKLVAKFQLQEEWRQDIKAIIKKLKSQQIEPILLSGDSAGNCSEFDSQLKLEASLSPEKKRLSLIDFRKRVGPVLMLGDGINDLPALAQADVSASVLESPEVVKSKCDIVLVSRHLQPIEELLRVTRCMQNIIRQNLVWAAGYNITMIPLAMSGYLQPWMAALGMSLSSLLVVLNAARLQGRGS